jgi:hypothetical protein
MFTVPTYPLHLVTCSSAREDSLSWECLIPRSSTKRYTAYPKTKRYYISWALFIVWSGFQNRIYWNSMFSNVIDSVSFGRWTPYQWTCASFQNRSYWDSSFVFELKTSCLPEQMNRRGQVSIDSISGIQNRALLSLFRLCLEMTLARSRRHAVNWAENVVDEHGTTNNTEEPQTALHAILRRNIFVQLSWHAVLRLIWYHLTLCNCFILLQNSNGQIHLLQTIHFTHC